MSRTAFIYPGQGAQKAGMGADFFANSSSAKRLYEQASEALGFDMEALCFEENEKLDITEYTQAAMVTTCLAMTRALEEETGAAADITAGLSLGEYCAVAVAGGISDADAVRLVRKRGILMQNAVPVGAGAMSAVMGMTGEEIERAIKEIADVSVANYNCPGQCVITGKTQAVGEAEERLKEAGAKRIIRLNVSGPFHSPLLKSAGEELRGELEKVDFHPLKLPYVTNVTAEKIEDIQRTKELLALQVSAPVRWEQSVKRMLADGVDTFVEIGPGRTLTGFLKKIDRNVRAVNIAAWEDLKKL